MKNNSWAINLMLDLKRTNFYPDQLRELQRRLFDFDADNEHIFEKAYEILIADRSPEAVRIMKKLAYYGDPQNNAGYGIEGLVLIGKGAIPEIMELLSCKEHDRVFATIDALFNPDGIEDVKYVSLPNLIFIRTEIKKQPQWLQIVSYLAHNKNKAWKRVKNVINDLLEIEELTKNIDKTSPYYKLFHIIMELDLHKEIAKSEIPPDNFIATISKFSVIDAPELR